MTKDKSRADNPWDSVSLDEAAYAGVSFGPPMPGLFVPSINTYKNIAVSIEMG